MRFPTIIMRNERPSDRLDDDPRMREGSDLPPPRQVGYGLLDSPAYTNKNRLQIVAKEWPQ
jgi:hypothetical protein